VDPACRIGLDIRSNEALIIVDGLSHHSEENVENSENIGDISINSSTTRGGMARWMASIYRSRRIDVTIPYNEVLTVFSCP
jgi:hypothetical protein